MGCGGLQESVALGAGATVGDWDDGSCIKHLRQGNSCDSALAAVAPQDSVGELRTTRAADAPRRLLGAPAALAICTRQEWAFGMPLLSLAAMLTALPQPPGPDG